jgi:hypothetical protein
MADSLAEEDSARALGTASHRPGRSRTWWWLLGLWCAVVPVSARAQNAEPECGARDCVDLGFLFTGETTRLGLQAVATATDAPGPAGEDFSVLSAYRAELYRDLARLSVHGLLRGALGGGTAGTHLELAGALDGGPRLQLSGLASLVLRAGPSALHVGHDRLRLGAFEPLGLHAGFVLRDGPTRLEGGLLTGAVTSGQLRVQEAAAGLAGALRWGAYVTARYRHLELDARLESFEPWLRSDRTRVAHVHVLACLPATPVLACAELRHLLGRVDSARFGAGDARAFYGGLFVGLTP